MARPALKRQAVDYIVSHHSTSERRACRLIQQHRSVQYYRSCKDPQLALRARMRELAQVRIRYGYRRIQVLLRREGWSVGKNRVYRLYCEEALQLRSKLPRRRRMVVTRRERYVPTQPGQAWSMDFVADQLVNGQRFRILTVVDVYTREALAVEPAPRMGAEGVVAICNRLAAQNRPPRRVFVDNGSEFSGRLFDLWAYHHGVRIDFSRPGKPTDNCFVETFNGSLRDECLNVHWFETLDDAKERIEAWRRDYNVSRPHQALKEMTPAAFAHQARLSGLDLVT
jgi:putative transposase